MIQKQPQITIHVSASDIPDCMTVVLVDSGQERGRRINVPLREQSLLLLSTIEDLCRDAGITRDAVNDIIITAHMTETAITRRTIKTTAAVLDFSKQRIDE